MTHSLDLDEFLEVKYYLTCLDPYHKKFITICIYLQKRMSSIIRNLNTSSIEKEVQTTEDLSLGFAIALPIFCATAAVSSVIILRTYLKDLNEVVKNILTYLSIHMAMASIGAAAILMFWNDDQDIHRDEVQYSPSSQCGKHNDHHWEFGCCVLHQILFGIKDQQIGSNQQLLHCWSHHSCLHRRIPHRPCGDTVWNVKL